MQIFQMLTNFFIQYQNITFNDIISDLTGKVFKYWEAVKLKMADINVPNLHSLLKLEFCLWQ